jgi:hypothetical protein
MSALCRQQFSRLIDVLSVVYPAPADYRSSINDSSAMAACMGFDFFSGFVSGRFCRQIVGLCRRKVCEDRMGRDVFSRERRDCSLGVRRPSPDHGIEATLCRMMWGASAFYIHVHTMSSCQQRVGLRRRKVCGDRAGEDVFSR